MYKGIFITGTDTGVGKTYVAVGLIEAFRKMGFYVCPMKPAETGCKIENGKLIPQDTFKIIEASGAKEPLEIINPYRFKFPLAPAVAAEIERRKIDKKKILSSYNYLSCKYDFTIVEGAGGIMVPLYKEYLFLDLVEELNIPLIIVSRPGLGTINHTLLTIEAVKSRGINIIGVVINYADNVKKGLAEKTNPEVIEELGGVPVLGVVPYSPKDPLEKTHTRYMEKVFLKTAEKIKISTKLL